MKELPTVRRAPARSGAPSPCVVLLVLVLVLVVEGRGQVIWQYFDRGRHVAVARSAIFPLVTLTLLRTTLYPSPTKQSGRKCTSKAPSVPTAVWRRPEASLW